MRWRWQIWRRLKWSRDKLDDAEKHIKAALAQNPNDAYNLSTSAI